MKAILAGSYWQFNDWLRESKNNPAECIYIAERNNLCGLPYGTEYIRIGTWYERPRDLKAMFAYEKERKGKEAK